MDDSESFRYGTIISLLECHGDMEGLCHLEQYGLIRGAMVMAG